MGGVPAGAAAAGAGVSIVYLTGASNPGVLAVAHAANIGLMAQPFSGHHAPIPQWPCWAADNGCFSTGTAFDVARFFAFLARYAAHRDRCLFAVAPDVICDHAATLARSLPVLPALRALGYRAAFVAQNGITVETTPWGAFDALFIGGDDPFKSAPETIRLIQAARKRGLWVHAGRVNSLRRLRAMAQFGCHSADGTFLKYGPDVNLPRLLGWLDVLQRQPALRLWGPTV